MDDVGGGGRPDMLPAVGPVVGSFGRLRLCAVPRLGKPDISGRSRGRRHCVRRRCRRRGIRIGLGHHRRRSGGKAPGAPDRPGGGMPAGRPVSRQPRRRVPGRVRGGGRAGSRQPHAVPPAGGGAGGKAAHRGLPGGDRGGAAGQHPVQRFFRIGGIGALRPDRAGRRPGVCL